MRIDQDCQPIALLYPPFRLGQGIHDLKRFYNDYPTKHAPEKFRFVGVSPVPVRTFDVDEETNLETSHSVLAYYDRNQFVIHFDRFSPVATGYLGVPRP